MWERSAAAETEYGQGTMRKLILIVLIIRNMLLELGWCFGGRLHEIRWVQECFLNRRMERRSTSLFIETKSWKDHFKSSGTSHLEMWRCQLWWKIMLLLTTRSAFLSELSWEWSVINTDLNIIEIIWAHIKHIISKKYAHFMSQRVMQELVVSIWKDFVDHKWDNLVESVPDRIQAVIRARGGFTQF